MHFPLASTHNELVWGGKGLERAQTSSRPALGSLNSATHLPRHARPQSSPPSRGGRSSAPGRAGRAAGASAVPTAASLTCFQPRCRGNVVAIGVMAGVPPVGTTLGKHHRSTACRGGGGELPANPSARLSSGPVHAAASVSSTRRMDTLWMPGLLGAWVSVQVPAISFFRRFYLFVCLESERRREHGEGRGRAGEHLKQTPRRAWSPMPGAISRA